MAIQFNGHLPSLQNAFQNGRLSFYLGEPEGSTSLMPGLVGGIG